MTAPFRVAFDPEHDTLEIYASESSWARDGRPLLSLTLEDARFLAALGREIATQDGATEGKGASHITTRPLYVVQERQRGTRHGRLVSVDGAASFTRSDAEQYIARDRHNLNFPELYVASIPERLPGMWRLRELLIKISRAAETPTAAPPLPSPPRRKVARVVYRGRGLRSTQCESASGRLEDVVAAMANDPSPRFAWSLYDGSTEERLHASIYHIGPTDWISAEIEAKLSALGYELEPGP